MTTAISKRHPSFSGDALLGLEPSTVLVPMLNLSVANDMLPMAAILACGSEVHRTTASQRPDDPIYGVPRVVVLGVVEVPEGQPLTTGLDMARSYRTLFDFIPSSVEVAGRSVRVDRIVKVARNVASAVREAVQEEGARTVLLYWRGASGQARRYNFGRVADDILKDPPCDVVVARPGKWREATRLLLPARGGRSAECALNVALLMSESASLPMTVMHNVPPTEECAPNGQESALAQEPYRAFSNYLNRVQALSSVPIERIGTAEPDTASAMLQEIREGDIVVMGMADLRTSVEPEDGAAGPLPLPLAVASEADVPLLLLRSREPQDLVNYTTDSPGASRESVTDAPFEYWFVQNTYYGDEFRDPEEFLKLKKASGLSLSVALLTLNDSRHIQSVLTGIKKVLCEIHPMADQIAVLDMGSTDGTVEIARSLGAEVYLCGEILPGEGNLPGRGEGWWKSLAVLRGDVLVWLDPRAPRFHPSTALALAGPLMRISTIHLVKAFEPPIPSVAGRRGAYSPLYDPAGDAEDKDVSWGGFHMPGRETGPLSRRVHVQSLRLSDLAALDAEQFASLPPGAIVQVFCPPLAGVVSPFSRDVAARRSAILDLPVLTGDNSDLGILLSVSVEYGTRSVAQVELHHAHPAPPPAASLRNAIDTLQTLGRRLQDPALQRYALALAERLQKEIERKSMHGGGSATSVFEVRALGLVERPPIRALLT
ncbi:MAG: hypothetical protein M3014_10025 [Chloroflexota bacterium]|nr:hypothetical protein [Chloroflexota bacterium]